MNTIKWDKVIALGTIVGLVAIVVHVSKPVEQVKTPRTWTSADSKAYAKDAINAWADKQYICLASMWGKESAWKHTAVNPEKIMGKHAGGIPQLLGMSPLTPPTIQIDRGLDYIYHRYGTPCEAWKFHKKNGWY
jgi:hypothetical protein